MATVEGRALTYGELEKYLRVLPPAMQQNAMRNRRQFVEQFFLMHRLSGMAEKDKLDQRSPYQESIAFNRMNILTQAEITQIYNQLPITPEDYIRERESMLATLFPAAQAMPGARRLTMHLQSRSCRNPSACVLVGLDRSVGRQYRLER